MGDKSLQSLANAVYRIAEDSPVIKKDVKDIRDAVCGSNSILGAIITLNKSVSGLDKKWTASQLLGKKGNKSNNNQIIKKASSIESLLKSILIKMDRIGGGKVSNGNLRNLKTDNDQKLKGLKGISKAIDVIEKLRSISFRDFLFAKKKVKHIMNIMSGFHNVFRNFKNTKEMEGTMSFANSSVDLMKKLSKVSLISIPAKLGARAIEKIMLGDGKKSGGLIALFRKLNLNKKDISKSVVLAKEIKMSCTSLFISTILLTGIAVTGVPAMLGALLLKGIVWILTGTFKVLSKASKNTLIGSTVLLIMSTSVVTFALGLGLMAKAVKGLEWRDFGMMMAAIGGFSAALTVMGIPVVSGLIALGSLTLVMMSASLGLFALSLMPWQKLDADSAIGNIKTAIGGLREAFGLELGNHGGENKTFGQRIGDGLKDFAMSIINFGSSFFMMGSLLLAGVSLGLLYHGLKRWENFNAKKSMKNIKTAISGLKKVFGIDDKPKQDGLKEGKLKKLGGSILDMGITLMQGGKALAQMAVLTIATGMSDAIRLTLNAWKTYPDGAIKNLGTAIGELKKVFGLEEKNENLKDKGINLGGSILDMGIALLQGGSVFTKLATITIATGMSDIIKLNLQPWESYDGSKATKNLGTTIGSLVKVFGLEDTNEGLDSDLQGLHNGGLLDLATTLLRSGNTFFKMGTITLATGLASKIKDYVKPWENYNATKAIGNIGIAVDGLLDLFGITNKVDENASLLKTAWDGLKNITKSAINTVETVAESGSALAKVGSIALITDIMANVKESLDSFNDFDSSFKSTVNTINSIDVTKAAKAVELFKAFSNLNYKPIDKLTIAVDKFSESCLNLVNAIESFEPGTFTINGTEASGETKTEKSININNTQDLAEAIAKAMKTLPLNVKTDISDVRLIVDGNASRRVILTLDN